MVKVNEETHDLRPKIPYTLTDPQNVDSEKKYIDNGIRTKTSPYLPPWESKSSKSENEDTVTPFLFQRENTTTTYQTRHSTVLRNTQHILTRKIMHLSNRNLRKCKTIYRKTLLVYPDPYPLISWNRNWMLNIPTATLQNFFRK